MLFFGNHIIICYNRFVLWKSLLVYTGGELSIHTCIELSFICLRSGHQFAANVKDNSPLSHTHSHMIPLSTALCFCAYSRLHYTSDDNPKNLDIFILRFVEKMTREEVQSIKNETHKWKL